MENLDFDSQFTNSTKCIDQLSVGAGNQHRESTTDRSCVDTNRIDKMAKFGGYAFHFVVDPLPAELLDLLCKICHLPSKDPHLSECCGHTFCKSCADYSKQNAAYTNDCPLCRQSDFPLFPNKQIDRRVKALHVYCTNESDGCPWKGEINKIVAHLDCCQYESVECEINGCGSLVQRQHLKIHMKSECSYRDVRCVHCGLVGIYLYIVNEHKDECPKLPISCQNGCGVTNVARDNMDEHRKTCPLEMMKCEYHDMGCEGEIARKDIDDHSRENAEEHLIMLKCKLAKTKNEVERIQRNTAVAEKSLIGMQKKIEKMIKDAKAQGQENIKRLKTQLFNSLCQLHKGCNAWALMLNAQAEMSTSGEQVVPVVLKLTNFSKMKRNREWWHSSYFYCCNKECKMYLSVHPGDNPNRKDSCTYLSVQLSTVSSASGLPLKGIIKLLNQIDDQGHYCVTVGSTVAKSEWKIASFISHGDLSNFLRNDCLFFEVEVIMDGTENCGNKQHLYATSSNN